MKKVVRLTEADLVRIVKRVIEEQEDIQWMRDDENPENMYYKTPGRIIGMIKMIGEDQKKIYLILTLMRKNMMNLTIL